MADTTLATDSSLATALEQAQPGDRIGCDGATHSYSNGSMLTIEDVSGTAADPIVVEANNPSARPTFEWEGGYDDFNATGGLRLRNCSYIEFVNLDFERSPYFGIRPESSDHLTFRNVRSRNHGLSGLYLTNGSEQCLTIGGSYSDNGTGNSAGNADGIGMSGGGNGSHTFVGVDMRHNTDDGCDNYDVPRNTWIGCRSWNNGHSGGNGIGYKLGIDPNANNAAGNDTGGHLVHNCLCWDNDSRGFDYNNANLPIELNHCTSWNNNNPDYRMFGAAHVLRNNIQAGREGAAIGSECIEESNSWQIGAAPQFASTTPADDDFLVATASEYIGTGSTDATIPEQATYPYDPPNIGPYVVGSDSTESGQLVDVINVSDDDSDYSLTVDGTIEGPR